MIYDRIIRGLETSLNMSLKNSNIIGSNLANIDTPGYLAKKLEFQGKMTMWAAVYDTFKSLSNTAVGKIVTTRHDLSMPAQTTVTVAILDEDASLFDKASAALRRHRVWPWSYAQKSCRYLRGNGW